MRKVWFATLILGLGLGVWGCADRENERTSSLVRPPVHTGETRPGELHNEVMQAFAERAPLESIPSMQWDEWLETTLNSMEAVCVTHDLPFDRAATTRHIIQLTKVFGALKQATGIDPGMLRESADPAGDFGRLITQMRSWKVIDQKTAETVSTFQVDDRAAARAESITDEALRDVFRIGASSREFWLVHDPRAPMHALAGPGDDDGTPCKKCNVGATISDFLGGMVGRLLCGGDPTCRVMMAAAASLIYNMASGYCDNHPCGFDSWWPPITLP